MPMIELNPAFPVLWRDERAVQLGARPAACVVDDPAPWQLALLDALRDGIPAGRIAGVAIALGAEPDEASTFLATIAPALREVQVPHELSLVTTDRVAHAAVLGVCDALEDAGFRPVRRTTRDAVAAAPHAVVLAGEGVVPPVLARELMRADVPHVPLALGPDGAVVGPFVVPGETACLACVWEHERDRDPQWPVLAAQLVAPRGAPSSSRALATLAASLVTRVVASFDESSGRTRSVSVTADGRRRWRSHRPHEACLCRSPRGSEMVDAVSARHRATTRSTASAPHA